MKTIFLNPELSILHCFNCVEQGISLKRERYKGISPLDMWFLSCIAFVSITLFEYAYVIKGSDSQPIKNQQQLAIFPDLIIQNTV